MRNYQQCAIGKLLSDGSLENCVRTHIHRTCGFVEDDNLRACDDSASEVEELALALGEVETACDIGVERSSKILAFWVLCPGFEPGIRGSSGFIVWSSY